MSHLGERQLRTLRRAFGGSQAAGGASYSLLSVRPGGEGAVPAAVLRFGAGVAPDVELRVPAGAWLSAAEDDPPAAGEADSDGGEPAEAALQKLSVKDLAGAKARNGGHK